MYLPRFFILMPFIFGELLFSEAAFSETTKSPHCVFIQISKEKPQISLRFAQSADSDFIYLKKSPAQFEDLSLDTALALYVDQMNQKRCSQPPVNSITTIEYRPRSDTYVLKSGSRTQAYIYGRELAIRLWTKLNSLGFQAPDSHQEERLCAVVEAQLFGTDAKFYIISPHSDDEGSLLTGGYENFDIAKKALNAFEEAHYCVEASEAIHAAAYEENSAQIFPQAEKVGVQKGQRDKGQK